MNPAFNGLMRPAFSSKASAHVFSNGAWIAAMVDVEAALAKALARHGVIDDRVAMQIAECCRDASANATELANNIAAADNPVDALLQHLTMAVASRDADAANFVHWGATNLDLIDTAMVLQLRAALDLIEADLEDLVGLLAQRSELYRHTAQAGRTGMQQVLPVTFGLKTAGWLDALMRHQQRLSAIRPRLLALQFGGAAGSLGANALPIAADLASALDLTMPDMPWLSQRDRFAEVASVLGMLAGSLGKMAGDMALLSQTEVAELNLQEVSASLATPASPGMPRACAIALSAAQRVPALVATMLAGMMQESESGTVEIEWDTLPHIVMLCATALEQMRAAVLGMTVDATRMRTNLDLTRGQILAEAVMVALTPKVGRCTASMLLRDACSTVARSGLHLREVLDQMSAVTTHLGPAELDRLLEPASYFGQSAIFVERVLQTRRQTLHRPLSTGVLNMPTLESSSVNLNYQLEGSAESPCLILSNPLGATLDIWAPQMPSLLEHFRVLRYDTRGQGQSSVPEGPYTIAQMAADVLTLMDHLGVVRTHFCGLSMGGMTGLWLAINHPARIDRLVLANTAPLLGPQSIWDERIEQVRQHGMGAIAETMMDRWFTRDFQQHAVHQVHIVRDMLLHTPVAGYIAGCHAVRDMDLRDSLANINAPTLVIGGRHDKSTAPAQTRRLAEHINGARYLELNAAHLTNWEVAQSFTANVMEFLLVRSASVH
jgi:3-carboxy-cis,cis-muconate cycloisomerase